MLDNPERATKKIVEWLRNYAKTHGKEHWITIDQYPNTAAKVLLKLCQRTNIPTTPVFWEGSVPSVDRESFQLLNAQAEANDANGLVVNWYSKEWLRMRFYKKGYIGDLFPLGDLYTSEIDKLYLYLTEQEPEATVIHGISSEQLEWAIKEDNNFGIIYSEQDPTKSREWGRYTLEQRRLIAKLNQKEKLTRHKAINIPIFKIRGIPGLVR